MPILTNCDIKALVMFFMILEIVVDRISYLGNANT